MIKHVGLKICSCEDCTISQSHGCKANSVVTSTKGNTWLIAEMFALLICSKHFQGTQQNMLAVHMIFSLVYLRLSTKY